MAINVNWSPVQTIEDMAFVAGQGEANKWLVELQQRQALAQQAAALRQQEMQAQLADRQQERFFDQQRFVAGAQLQQQNLQQKRQWEVADQAQQEQAIRERMGLEQKDLLARQDHQAKIQWEAQAAQGVERDVDAEWSFILKNKELLNEADKGKFNEAARELENIKRSKAIRTPQDYARILSEVAGKHDFSGMRERMKPPPTKEERFADSVVERPGYGLFSENRSGAWGHIADPPEQKADAELKATLGKMLIGTKKVPKVVEGEQTLVDVPYDWADFRRVIENHRRIQDHLAGKEVPPTAEELAAEEAKKAQAAEQAAQQAAYEKAVAEHKAALALALPEDQLHELEAIRKPVLTLGPDGKRLEPGEMRIGDHIIGPDGKRKAQDGPDIKHLRGVSQETRAAAQQILPRVNSAAEVMQLEPGTRFIDRNGDMRIVPDRPPPPPPPEPEPDPELPPPPPGITLDDVFTAVGRALAQAQSSRQPEVRQNGEPTPAELLQLIASMLANQPKPPEQLPPQIVQVPMPAAPPAAPAAPPPPQEYDIEPIRDPKTGLVKRYRRVPRESVAAAEPMQNNLARFVS